MSARRLQVQAYWEWSHSTELQYRYHTFDYYWAKRYARVYRLPKRVAPVKRLLHRADMTRTRRRGPCAVWHTAVELHFSSDFPLDCSVPLLSSKSATGAVNQVHFLPLQFGQQPQQGLHFFHGHLGDVQASESGMACSASL
jgi:hypothetical protein